MAESRIPSHRRGLLQRRSPERLEETKRIFALLPLSVSVLHHFELVGSDAGFSMKIQRVIWRPVSFGEDAEKDHNFFILQSKRTIYHEAHVHLYYGMSLACNGSDDSYCCRWW